MLVYFMMPAAEPQDNLTVLVLDILEEYRAAKVENRFSTITPTMFSTKSGAKLKGKAADVKDLGPVLAKVFKKYYDPEAIAVHKEVECMLRMSAHLDTILDANTHEFVLADEPARDLVATGFTYMQIWVGVAKISKSVKNICPLDTSASASA